MSDYWGLPGGEPAAEPAWMAGRPSTAGSVPSPRKEQITIRLDPGMIEDARVIAARKGIGHHTLLRMWVMEGITRAYQEGLLDRLPEGWTKPPRRGSRRSAERAAAESGTAPPSGTRWTRARPQV